MTEYEVVIGLEVHAQLRTRTKLFCACSTAYGAPPNTNICPVCLGLPGALPVPNESAIRLAIRAALALDCTVETRSVFARKSYFYPDLAKGYQISQFELPLNTEGGLHIGAKRAGIERIHVEEDAAKNIHASSGETIVDFNRAGVPLIEIVGKPDLRSPEEAERYLRALHETLIFIGVNDGNLQEGSFRCDANISIRPMGRDELGTRTELKNINSFRFVRLALDAEIARQIALVESGGTVVQQTRTWSEATGQTRALRSKEEAEDYRYFPDPDLPALVVTAEEVERARDALPELPVAKRARWVSEWGLRQEDANVLGAHPAVAAYFESVVESLGSVADAGRKAANFVRSEVKAHIVEHGLEASLPAPAQDVAALLLLVESKTINGKIAKKVFAIMAESGRRPGAIVEEEGLAQVTDTAAIDAIVAEVIDANPAQAKQYREGKMAVLGYFVGQVMKASRGKANPQLVKETLQRLL